MQDREPVAEAAVELGPFRPADRPSLVALWNRLFRERPLFTPMTEERWRRRVEEALPAGPERFDPEFLRVARAGGTVIGFAHGGLWSGPYARLLRPGPTPAAGGDSGTIGTGAEIGASAGLDHDREPPVGFLALIGVDAPQRRRGVGRRLLADLRSVLERRAGRRLELVADGRQWNPFHGNSTGPVPPPWGTPEGIAVPAGDDATGAFLTGAGFRIAARAATVVRPASQPLPPLPGPGAGDPAAQPVLEVADGIEPRPGTPEAAPFPVAGAARTWMLRAPNGSARNGSARSTRAPVPGIILGALVGYPLSPQAWAIHSLEVVPEARGRGLGERLLAQALHDVGGGPGRSPVTAPGESGASPGEIPGAAPAGVAWHALVIPDEAPAAARLYARHGFVEAHRWLVFE